MPAAGVALFFVLYAAAALHYPGGSDVDKTEVGFSFFHNYWCDLLDPVAGNGQPNGGQRFAQAALLVAVLTLASYWQVVVALYRGERALVISTRLFGGLSAAATLLLYTPLHDRAVELGGGLGLVALVASLIGLLRAGRRRLVAGGIVAGTLSVACLFIWRAGVALQWLAPLQKLAFVAFFGWVFVASLGANTGSKASRVVGEPARGRTGRV